MLSKLFTSGVRGLSHPPSPPPFDTGTAVRALLLPIFFRFPPSETSFSRTSFFVSPSLPGVSMLSPAPLFPTLVLRTSTRPRALTQSLPLCLFLGEKVAASYFSRGGKCPGTAVTNSHVSRRVDGDCEPLRLSLVVRVVYPCVALSP